jgi:hypothetical protein
MSKPGFVGAACAQVGWVRSSFGGTSIGATIALCGHPYAALLLVIIEMLLRTIAALAFSPFALEIAKSLRPESSSVSN